MYLCYQHGCVDVQYICYTYVCIELVGALVLLCF